MSEIKFKAWHIEESKMGEVYQLDLKDGFVELKFPDRPLAENYPSERIILLQYIDLKDKNGVEIYVGDLVRFVAPPSIPYPGDPFIGEVFRDKEPRFMHTFLEGRPSKCLWHYIMEKVGTIYENPELLKG